ncbi:MAG: XTP/dITP diphosphatase [Thiofilum sp.]|uniref:XTP/dITP diphosphatase n=1 Tax=Thiofilum sp. TaxID=2212733 RepID=UPI0025DB40FF|nr:XTP/dITP diphosphatase [Thiofilum sp.]MBK8452693.1 XTP/dITP diphosphatase [Thiofilum sp.]
MSTKTVVLASNNQGKVREFAALLADFGYEVINQGQLHVPEAQETGLSFIENALLKARHASRLTGLPALADDSGLVVHALKGAPGIYSARFAGTPTNDAANNAKLLQALADVPTEQRTAHFHCCLAWVDHADDPTPLIAEARWQGRILTAPQGNQGFGYDPLFYVPEHDCTAAQMDKALKNQLSHRAQALNLLKQRLQSLC